MFVPLGGRPQTQHLSRLAAVRHAKETHNKARAGRALSLWRNTARRLFGNRAACAVQGDAFLLVISGVSGDFFGAVAKEGQSVIKAAAGGGGGFAFDRGLTVTIREFLLREFAFSEGDIAVFVFVQVVNMTLSSFCAKINVVGKFAAFTVIKGDAVVGRPTGSGDGGRRGFHAIGCKV